MAASPTLAHLGEDALIALLTRGLPQGAEVRVAAGDDCAVIAVPAGSPGNDPQDAQSPQNRNWLLLKTDAVLEGVHFLPAENARRVGWKALCRAISDIAAMGGVPAQALITLAAAPSVEVAWVRALYQGLKKAARRFNVSIVGGETSRSTGPIFINVTLTGWVEPHRCVLRSGGKPGDSIYVTGRLGGSIAGKHLDFLPRLEEARWLGEHFPLHSMMDLSDGLGADLPRLAAASRCGFVLDQERIPRTRGSTLEAALSDGEDFELLFTLCPKDGARLEAQWKARFPKLPLSRIGALTRKAKPGQIAHGFDHFA